MILPDLPAFLAGKYQPRDNDERLALLGVCQFTNRTLAAARLYADAFAADPRLAEDFRVGHRSNAARYAALAGCGRGADAGLARRSGAEGVARAGEGVVAGGPGGLGQALDADPAATREPLKQRLTEWRGDPDLAGVREAAELAKLPADERKEWLAFWAEVEAMLDRCVDRVRGMVDRVGRCHASRLRA